jgi:hypothetical protein
MCENIPAIFPIVIENGQGVERLWLRRRGESEGSVTISRRDGPKLLVGRRERRYSQFLKMRICNYV